MLDLKPTEGRVTITIEQVHELQRSLLLRPERPLPRVVIIDPADSLSEPAMNALLKILEEPPDGVTLILLTEHLPSVLPTIQSRSHIVRFYPASEEQVRAYLVEELKLAPADADLAAALSGGSLGEAKRLSESIESTRTFVKTLLETVHKADYSTIVDTLLKAKEASETRRRAALAFQVLALAHRDALKGRTSVFGPMAGNPDRWLKAIDVLLEHEIFVGMNANVGLAVSDALLQVGP